jgi:hypothetical protein
VDWGDVGVIRKRGKASVTERLPHGFNLRQQTSAICYVAVPHFNGNKWQASQEILDRVNSPKRRYVLHDVMGEIFDRNHHQVFPIQGPPPNYPSPSPSRNTDVSPFDAAISRIVDLVTPFHSLAKVAK